MRVDFAMNGDPLDDFIDKLINEKNLSGLDDEARPIVATELKELLIANINKAIISEFPEEKAEELNAMMDAVDSDPEQVRKFLESNVDAQRITAEELMRFRSLYLGIN